MWRLFILFCCLFILFISFVSCQFYTSIYWKRHETNFTCRKKNWLCCSKLTKCDRFYYVNHYSARGDLKDELNLSYWTVGASFSIISGQKRLFRICLALRIEEECNPFFAFFFKWTWTEKKRELKSYWAIEISHIRIDTAATQTPMALRIVSCVQRSTRKNNNNIKKNTKIKLNLHAFGIWNPVHVFMWASMLAVHIFVNSFFFFFSFDCCFFFLFLFCFAFALCLIIFNQMKELKKET